MTRDAPEMPGLPAGFTAMIESLAAPQLAELPAVLCSTAPSVSVRWNGLKGLDAPADADRVAWWPRGQYLAERPRFTLDPAMHQGLYYVQDASSMVTAEAARRVIERGYLPADTPLRALDACAAPGGKTQCLIEALPARSLVVANEFSPQRAAALAENVVKHGSPSTVVTRGDAAALGESLPAMFDLVNVDAPCSGEGMMRKEAVARTQWSPKLIDDCVATQRAILKGVWQALRPGGVLLYSTCTFNPFEDERRIAWLADEFGAEPLDLGLAGEWGIDGAIEGTAPCARFVPGHIRGEGLFLAAVRKPDGPCAPAARGGRTRHQRQQQPAADARRFEAWTTRDAGPLTWQWSADGQTLSALPEIHAREIELICSRATTLRAGVEVAQMKGRSAIPAHALAMSTLLAPEAFATAEVDLATALSYLRRETITLPSATPRGIVLLTHGGHPLGFANNLGNRANNLYPQQWRILSAARP